ncbi:hypothetical protein (nucleomorph) [Guillardia theta]|uniref:[histone H3]-lysine(4) N-trimethyltransferase n=1 Tax=Guillardia theta TaxID=55529 RepID=Q98RM4_GUITH|nr:hypothetical protein GTHECHR1131 [Guillardia theta]AAK39924.1 hypothetical protein [Guillardia theta]
MRKQYVLLCCCKKNTLKNLYFSYYTKFFIKSKTKKILKWVILQIFKFSDNNKIYFFKYFNSNNKRNLYKNSFIMKHNIINYRVKVNINNTKKNIYFDYVFINKNCFICNYSSNFGESCLKNNQDCEFEYSINNKKYNFDDFNFLNIFIYKKFLKLHEFYVNYETIQSLIGYINFKIMLNYLKFYFVFKEYFIIKIQKSLLKITKDKYYIEQTVLFLDTKNHKTIFRNISSYKHNLGVTLVSKLPIFTILFEYRGFLVHNYFSDNFERFYKNTNLDNYLFLIDDLLIIDATIIGNIARFVNHSCLPNCNTKISVHGCNKHIIIINLSHILISTEINYNYRILNEYFHTRKNECFCYEIVCNKYLEL